MKFIMKLSQKSNLRATKHADKQQYPKQIRNMLKRDDDGDDNDGDDDDDDDRLNYYKQTYENVIGEYQGLPNLELFTSVPKNVPAYLVLACPDYRWLLAT